MTSAGRRTAFTLVELLATIAIVGLLVALLLPAVQSARESARRVTCANRLRQIGIALNGFNSQFGSMPGATSYFGGPPTAADLAEIQRNTGGIPHSPWNWLTQLLPLLDQKNLYDRLDFAAVWTSGGNLTAARTPLPELACPSDPKSSAPLFGTSANAMALWYVGCYGPVMLDCYAPYATQAAIFCDSGNNRWCGNTGHNGGLMSGIFSRASRPLAVARIRDGMSMTIAVGETLPFDWRVYNAAMTPNFPMATLAIPFNTPLSSVAANSGGNIGGSQPWTLCETTGFKSAHPMAVNFVFCDGSVRTLPATIDYKVQCALGTYRGSTQPTASVADAVLPSESDL
jgi:prepilin-type N-terminal cleavage/methylation domain-containing protein/prepilin-type processing-associated H-X9-DG protein